MAQAPTVALQRYATGVNTGDDPCMVAANSTAVTVAIKTPTGQLRNNTRVFSDSMRSTRGTKARLATAPMAGNSVITSAPFR